MSQPPAKNTSLTETSLRPPPGMAEPPGAAADDTRPNGVALTSGTNEPTGNASNPNLGTSLAPPFQPRQRAGNQSSEVSPWVKLSQKPFRMPVSDPSTNETPLRPLQMPQFSKSRPTLPPLKLTSSVSAIQRTKFSLPTKAKTPTKNSRTAFLTAALSPSFVSAKPLHTRTHTTISEVVGNLAPERYLSLPPRSSPAAKALLATSVCKELRDVNKLETIRKRHGDVEGGGWFDYVLDSLGNGAKITKFADRMKNLVIPPWDGIVDRVAFLPLESLNIDSVMGQDFSALVKKKDDNLRISKTRAVESSEVKISRLKNAIKAQIARKVQAESKVVASVQLKPTPADNPLIDDDLRPPLQSARNTLTAEQPSKMTTTAPANNATEIFMIDDDTPAQSSAAIPVPKPRVELPVSLVFDDVTGKVSIDWDIREIPPKPTVPSKSTTPPKSATLTPAQVAKTPSTNPSASKKRNTITKKVLDHQNPSTHVQTTASAAPVATRSRSNAPLSNLETLLGRLDDDIIPPAQSAQQEKTPTIDPEIVVVDGAKGAPAPKPMQLRTKRRRADKAQERAAENEQRASRMRSAVVSALQEDPETRRQRTARSSTANGNAKGKKKVSFSGRRMSRRSKKNVAPILDFSSGSEKDYRRDQDDDFTIDADDVIEVLPVPKGNGTRAPVPNLIPPAPRPPPSLGREAPDGLTEVESLDGSDMISPKLRSNELRRKHVVKKLPRAGPSKHVRSHRSVASGSKRERHRPYDDETHEEEPELWNREILRVERLLEENEQDGDPLQNQIEYNPYRFYEQVPILRRVIKAAKAQHGHLMDMDKVDEYEEMAQFYDETRSDPQFGSGNGCPGTEFLESVFQQTERERLTAMHGYAGETTDNALGVLGNERLDVSIPDMRSGVVSGLAEDVGHPSSPSQHTSDSSAESSEEEQGAFPAGSKRSRSQARSRASKARELQSRVCGDLLATMTSEARRRVLRWAERDFTWFDRGVDVMEIVASRAYKRCSRCDSGGGEEENCEESILLKLWKDMSWRKVRRMRHRSSGTN